MIYGIGLLIIDALLYNFLPHKEALAVIVLLSTIINTITDLKWRYVDDQYVYQPIVFSLLYTYQNNALPYFFYVNIAVFLFSFFLYAIGAWSSGDVTAMTAAAQILFIFNQPLKEVITFIAIFALVYFVAILTYSAIKTRGKIFSRPSTITTLESTFIALALYTIAPSYALAIILAISFVADRVNKYAYHVIGAISAAYVIYAGVGIIPIIKTFIAMYIFSYIFSSTNGIEDKLFTTPTPATNLKEGDVIKEMIVEKDDAYHIVPVTLKNIINVKTIGAKIVIQPSSEGLSKEEIEKIREIFPNAVFRVHKTIPIVPFILATIVLLFLPVL